MILGYAAIYCQGGESESVRCPAWVSNIFGHVRDCGSVIAKALTS